MHSVPAGTPWAARDRETYYAAAWQLLAEKGPGGVTVAGLCDHLGATKGSFYHHFEDMPGFVAAFSARWQDWMVHRFGSYRTEPDPVRQVEAMANTSFQDMTPGHGGIRAWARTSPAVAEAMPAVHRTAKDSAGGALSELAGDEGSGDVFAGLALSFCVGLQLRPEAPNRERFLRRVALIYGAMGLDCELLHRAGGTRLRVVSWQRLVPVTDPIPAIGPLGIRARPAGHRRPVGRRVGMRQQYYAAAWDLLSERGSDCLTIANLAQRLEVTSGAFQYQFGSMPRFLQQLAAEWSSYEFARTDRAAAEPDPWRRLEHLLGDLLVAPSPAETAWQAWGHSNPLVAVALQQVQDDRKRAITMTLDQIRPRPENELLADTTLALGLGLHRWHPPRTPAHVACVAREWMRRGLHVDAEVGVESGTPRLLVIAA
ncbi:MAG TPA: TetR/AcrR family transcriptional regulator [Sporichthyaceae bacterium]|jgi:AcrR family transcriptional regulator|nr:TetR/AcrR family transcriptional regulator [Sporichthyaceae bacterium]